LLIIWKRVWTKKQVKWGEERGRGREQSEEQVFTIPEWIRIRISHAICLICEPAY